MTDQPRDLAAITARRLDSGELWFAQTSGGINLSWCGSVPACREQEAKFARSVEAYEFLKIHGYSGKPVRV